MSAISFHEKQIIRHNVLIGKGLLENPTIIASLVVWVVVLDDSCEILIRFWEMSFAFSIDHP